MHKTFQQTHRRTMGPILSSCLPVEKETDYFNGCLKDLKEYNFELYTDIIEFMIFDNKKFRKYYYSFCNKYHISDPTLTKDRIRNFSFFINDVKVCTMHEFVFILHLAYQQKYEIECSVLSKECCRFGPT
jgi:hypothetical protein